ncbi:uncharacterized protein LOC134770827 [Penaeus indicus]|uniref:uncharacterized protein LOC134770827 n=1 Tax=Penaeus indicus TaxID=29960 RepID=UPI00300C2353
MLGILPFKRDNYDLIFKKNAQDLTTIHTRWKGSKARELGAGYKLFYHGEVSGRNGVGVVVKEKHINGVLEVHRMSDRIMSVKLEIEGMVSNIISAYAQQVGCDREDKEEFWEKLDDLVQLIPREERLNIGADFNGHIGEGNGGDERAM